MSVIIDGKRLADSFCEGVRERVQELKASGVHPRLAIINANNSKSIRNIVSAAEKTGVALNLYDITEDMRSTDVAELIQRLNDSKDIHGVSLATPLSRNMQFHDLVNMIIVNKDVDGLTTLNQGRLYSGEPGMVPPAPLGIIHLIRTIHHDVTGMNIAVLGRSAVVGRPLAQLLLNANSTVTLLHSLSKNLPETCRAADIVVSAVGQPNFITEEFVKAGATVIDVGLNLVNDNWKQQLVGDVDYDAVSSVAGHIATSIDGVLPMTVAHLMHNTLKLACCY